MVVGRHVCQHEEERKGDISTALMRQEQLFISALQGHSGRNLIDPLLQDNVVIQRRFFQHFYHIGCAF